MASDVATPVFVTGCRALGIPGKLLTAPLWRALADDSTPFAAAIKIYQDVTTRLAAWAEDAAGLLDGSAVPFPGAQVSRGC